MIIGGGYYVHTTEKDSFKYFTPRKWINDIFDMKISVIVCTYNQAERLRKMLGSLREAEIPDNLSYEIILVDNNSDDHTRFVLEEDAQYYKSKIRYVFEEKRGLSNARNRGIKEARGEIIAFTDDDVIADKYWIQNTEKAFKEHKDAACVGGKILPIWEVSRPKWLHPSLYNFLGLLDYGNAIAYMDSPDIWGANFAVKSEMFKKYGLFDPILGRTARKLYGGEETEFLQRLRSAGEKILYYPSSIVYHFLPAHKMSKKYFRKWNFDAGELYGILMKDMKYSNSLNIYSLTAKKIFRDIIVSILKIGCLSKNRFSNELKICYIFGLLSGKMKRMNMKS